MDILFLKGAAKLKNALAIKSDFIPYKSNEYL